MNNIPTNLSVASLLPNDPKVWVKNKTELASLGATDYKAFIYYEGLRVYCAENKEIYEWREEVTLNETGGLVASTYTYPNGLIVNNVDYSLRKFNFFRVLLPEDVQANLDDALNDIAANSQSYQVSNVGSGSGLYKNTTIPVANTNQFNFKSVLLENAEPTGTTLISGITPTADEISLRMKTLDSDTLVFDTSVTGKLQINLPSVSSFLDFYVRHNATVTYFDWLGANTMANGGTPIVGYEYKGTGTIAKPFVDTVVYTLGSPLAPPTITNITAMVTARAAYVGLGTDLSPQFGGRRIIIQRTGTDHWILDNLNINGLIVRIEAGAALYHNPVAITGEDSWLVNLDHSSIGVDAICGVSFELETGAYITLQRNGFKNKGTSLGTYNYSVSKQVVIRSEGGVVFQNNRIETGDTPGDYIMFDMNGDGTGAGTGTYKNDGNALLSVVGGNCFSIINPIFKGGVHVSDFTGTQFTYGANFSDIDPTVVPFIESVAGLYTRIDKCSFYNFGLQIPETFFKISGTGSTVLLIAPLVNGAAESLVEIEPHPSNANLDPVLAMYNGTNKDGFTATVTLFKVNGVRVERYRGIYFNNNYITKGFIDETKIDLTGGNYQGVVNFIGRQSDSSKQVSYFLPRFGSRAAALGGTMEVGNLFINTNGLPIDTPHPSWTIDIII